MTNIDHPLYQFRHLLPDGTQKIADMWNGTVQDAELYRDMVFGYWRPGAFTFLTTLAFVANGDAVITGLHENRVVRKKSLTLDPYGANQAFYDVALSDERNDRDRREANTQAREDENALWRSFLVAVDAHIQTAMPVEGGVYPATDELSVRKMLDHRRTILYGRWDAATGSVPYPIARLDFLDGPTIVCTASSGGRRVIFEADVAKDLDRVAHLWMDFSERVREEVWFEKVVSDVRADVSAA